MYRSGLGNVAFISFFGRQGNDVAAEIHHDTLTGGRNISTAYITAALCIAGTQFLQIGGDAHFQPLAIFAGSKAVQVARLFEDEAVAIAGQV